jgi:hypothetical protein
MFSRFLTDTNSPAPAILSLRPGRNVEERPFRAALRFGERRALAPVVVVLADAAIPKGARAHIERTSNAALKRGSSTVLQDERWAGPSGLENLQKGRSRGGCNVEERPFHAELLK